MSKQSSSVEWFLDKLIEHEIIKIGQTTYGDKVNYKHEILFEQAKAMHKEEIVKSWSNGYDEDDRATSSPLKYYEQTYGGDK